MRSLHSKLLACAPLLISLLSCKPAGYEIIKKKPSGTQSPNTITQPSATPPRTTGNLPPTARVEVIKDGYSITTVRVGIPVTLRPSLDTLDADDAGVTACINPGITKAAYTVGSEASPASIRQQGCEPLGVPYTFTRAGLITIGLVVTSNENETASAAVTLMVTQDAAGEQNGGGFIVNATPMIQTVGGEIVFSSRCDAAGSSRITWDFGDSTRGESAEIRHIFTREGQFAVNANCTTSSGRVYSALVTIVIIPGNIPKPPPITPTPMLPPVVYVPQPQRPPIQSGPNQPIIFDPCVCQ